MSDYNPVIKEEYDYVIIGADAAGNSAVGQIRRNDKKASIGMFERGDIIAYGACGLPYAVSGKIDDIEKLVHFNPQSFGNRNNADVIASAEVVDVNLSEKTVLVKLLKTNEEKTVKYGKLLIGTGADPIKLPFVDYSSERVFELKSVPDGYKIKNFVEKFQPKKGAIIGAGYIALETAEAFNEMGIDVDMFTGESGRPISKFPKSLSKSVAEILSKNNINLITDTTIKNADFESDKVTLHFSDEPKEYDFLFIAIGMAPATKFLEKSGLKLEKGAIVVNAKGETSDHNVWSGGDCALVYHHLLKKAVYLPLGHTANKQGRIAGMNMSGADIKLPGVLGTQVFKLFDTAFASTGISLAEAEKEGYDAVEVSAMRPSKAGYYPGSGKAKMTLVIDKKHRKLLGAFYSGPMHAYGMIDTAAAMIQSGMSLDDIEWFDAAYAPPFAPVWNALISAAGKFT